MKAILLMRTFHAVHSKQVGINTPGRTEAEGGGVGSGGEGGVGGAVGQGVVKWDLVKWAGQGGVRRAGVR